MRSLNPQFVGRQFGRLRIGHIYIALVLQMLTALSLVKLAFNLPFWSIAVLFFLGINGIWILGYYFDTRKIKTADDGKLLEQQLPHWRKMLKELLIEVNKEIKENENNSNNS
jgi:hypothetical protein